jgi:hypothetical protein
MRLEEVNALLPDGQRLDLGDDRSGQWPKAIPVREEWITAHDAAQRVLQAARSYRLITDAALERDDVVASVRGSSWSSLDAIRSGVEGVTLSGAILRANEVGAYLRDPAELEAFIHLIVNGRQAEASFGITAGLALWLPAMVALWHRKQDERLEEELLWRMLAFYKRLNGEDVSDEEIDAAVQSRLSVLRFMQALLRQPGATSHALNRYFSQQLWGTFGWLGAAVQSEDLFWRSAILVSGFAVAAGGEQGYNFSDESGADVLSWCGGDAQLYAAVRALQHRIALLSIASDPIPVISNTDPDVVGAELRQLQAMHDQVFSMTQSSEHALMVRKLAPAITEEVLLTVTAHVMRYRRELLGGHLPGALMDGLCWLFLNSLYDERANWGKERTTVINPVCLSSGPWSQAHYEKESLPAFDDGTDMSEIFRDWRLAETLFPLLAAVIGRLLRSHDQLGEEQTVYDTALGAFFPEPLPLDIEIRDFLTACGRIMGAEKGGGLRAEAIAAMLSVDCDEDGVLDWLACQPFTLQDIERQMLLCRGDSDELAMVLAGGLLETRGNGTHALPDWVACELDLIELYLAAYRSENGRPAPAGLLDAMQRGVVREAAASSAAPVAPTSVTGADVAPKRKRGRPRKAQG